MTKRIVTVPGGLLTPVRNVSTPGGKIFKNSTIVCITSEIKKPIKEGGVPRELCELNGQKGIFYMKTFLSKITSPHATINT